MAHGSPVSCLAKLLEHQAKDVLSRVGIEVPNGEVASSPAEVAEAAMRLGGAVAVKALVPSNRRGRRGGVRLAEDPAAAADSAGRILGMVLENRAVQAVLVEQRVAIERELFFSLILDRERRQVVGLARLHGGVDVEEEAAVSDGFETVELDPFGDRNDELLRALWVDAGLKGPELAETVELSIRAASAFFRYDLTVLELNPIALTDQGRRAVAVGALIAVDDAALQRQPEIAASVDQGGDGWRPPTPLEREALDVAAHEAHRGTARFIELEGEIGLLSGGGGGSQVVFEAVRRSGGRPACFTEIGGNPSAEKVRRLTEIVLRCRGVRGLLVAHNLTSNTQVDLVAEGVVGALADRQIDPRRFPVVAREAGTNDEVGRAIFERAGVEYLGQQHTLESAARRIVELVG